MISKEHHYNNRYLFKDKTELYSRVANTIISNDFALYNELLNIMMTETFIPAGNTLVAGVKPIAPNCAILGSINDNNFAERTEMAIKLWKQGTGIGVDLSELTDPVASLCKLSAINHSIDLNHRPKRGNMAVLNINHPNIKQFINCKINPINHNHLYNFNISVSISDHDDVEDDLWNEIAYAAWKTGDPGIILLSNGKNYGVEYADDLEPIVCCVPCGEQFMHTYETCNLGSINLNSSYLHTENQLDYDILAKTVNTAVYVMDKIIDLSIYPDESMKRISFDCRRIGLGVMGWADYLKRIGISYDSIEAFHLATKISKFITTEAENTSKKLAILYGPCKYSKTYRNISLTCIAPTGGIEGLVGLNGYSIEPYFEDALKYDYKAHINMQLAWQSGIHNAVSKTINLPEDTDVQTVKDALQYAVTSGCKGITIYRDQSKYCQPMKLDCTSCN